MTSIFDQFEQASLVRSKNNSTSSSDLNTPGYIHMRMEQELPIFSKTKMGINLPEKVTHVAISNKYLVAAMANNVLFRLSLNQTEQQDEVSFVKHANTGRLTNLFLDPTGNHILMSFVPKLPEAVTEVVYVSKKSNKMKTSTKFRGHELTEVGWNPANESESTTGPILLGTSKGLIFETEIVMEGDKFFTPSFSSGLEQYWSKVFNVGTGLNMPISKIQFDKIPGTDRYFVFVATPSRLYFYTGRANSDEKPLFQQVFSRYLNVPETETFVDVQSNIRYSRLRFWTDSKGLPTSMAWMTEKGITYGRLDLAKQEDINSIMKNTYTINYPKPMYEDLSVSQKPPITCVLTEFHLLLAYTDTIKGISILNKEVVYEDNYIEPFGRLINITKDPSTGIIWAITENAVFRFKVAKEERNAWKIYCENQQFDLAKKYSRDNPAYYDQVLVKEADMLFDKKEYELSAERYAETQTSFEEICLKFIEVDKRGPLKTFLRRKLDSFKPQDKTQITMIVVWLVELYLYQLEEMRIADRSQSAAYFEQQKEFQTFLALPQVSDCIKANKSTIYELMASHGDKSSLIQLTIVNKDFEQLIRQHIYKNSFLDALEVLKSQNNKELFYQFAPVLIQEIPKFTVKALIEQERKLSPAKLLPALVSCSGEFHAKEIVKYLEFCVEQLKSNEKAIHNLLVSLYAKYDPDKLMQYLNNQGQDIAMVNYDVHFALRLCREKNLTEACVQVSSLLGQWEAAVDLALKKNVELAKQIANMPPSNDVELRKKLWLKIAQHVVSGKDNIEQAIEFLHQCDLLKIEDILPFFSDFVTIDHCKEAICNSLKEYNQHIQDLKEEMKEATNSAEIVRQEIQSFRNRYTFIETSDTCEICGAILMTRPFYLFPCRHKFHTDCLVKELAPMLNPVKQNRLKELQSQLNNLYNNLQSQADSISTGSTGISSRDAIKTDIDNIIASECLYCGEMMIKNIDMPFIDEKDYDHIMKEWE